MVNRSGKLRLFEEFLGTNVLVKTFPFPNSLNLRKADQITMNCEKPYSDKIFRY